MNAAVDLAAVSHASAAVIPVTPRYRRSPSRRIGSEVACLTV